MGRTLNQTVLAGGKVYPAGTPEGDIAEGVSVSDDFFDGKAEPEKKPSGRSRSSRTES